MSSPKFIPIMAGVLLIVSLGLGGYVYLNKNNYKSKQSALPTQGQLPAGFPNIFPVELPGLVYGKVSDETGISGKLFDVRYASLKTVAEVYKDYRTLLTTKGFTITASQDKADQKSITARTTTADAQIYVSSQNGRTYVRITYLAREKAVQAWTIVPEGTPTKTK